MKDYWVKDKQKNENSTLPLLDKRKEEEYSRRPKESPLINYSISEGTKYDSSNPTQIQ